MNLGNSGKLFEGKLDRERECSIRGGKKEKEIEGGGVGEEGKGVMGRERRSSKRNTYNAYIYMGNEMIKKNIISK